MPQAVNPETGEMTWDGETVPAAGRETLRQAIANLSDEIEDSITIPAPFEGSGRILVSSGTGRVAEESGISIPADAAGTVALLGDANGNVQMGTGSLDERVNGSNNIALGDDALGGALNGNNNIAIGENTLLVLTTGSDNVAVGKAALTALTTGSDVVAMGERAGTALTSASSSVIIGDAALLVATSATQVVVVGKGACTTSSPGAQCVVIGNFAEVASNGDTNEIVIGYGAVGSGTNTTTIGNASTVACYIMGALIVEQPVVYPSFAKASLPSAASYAHGIIYVPDDTGGATMAFSDGTNWRRMADRAVVS